MRRAFASLYLIIVVAILMIGWGMDALWEAYNPETVLNEYESSLLVLVEAELEAIDDAAVPARVEALDAQLAADVSVYSLDDLSSTELGTEIRRGIPVLVTDQNGNIIIYKRLGERQHVLALRQPGDAQQDRSVYFILLVAFYLGLALVIYIWVWPLSRDLNRLEKQTRLVGKDGAAPLVELRRRSHVQNLADAFNSMSIRIKELLASRKEMTYAVSHELRTPLARMKFALEMAAESENEKHMREQLASVREDVAALDKFVSEFLNYASFDQSEQRLEMEGGDFLAFCESIVAELDTHDIDIHIRCEGQDMQAHCDWQLMERVLTNLLQNALRYARRRIDIVLKKTQGQLVVQVEDDGPGIPQDQRVRAFQSFVRLEGKSKSGKGYGLGLAIVKRILQWHSGQVSVSESALGGACFTLSWPADSSLD